MFLLKSRTWMGEARMKFLMAKTSINSFLLLESERADKKSSTLALFNVKRKRNPFIKQMRLSATAAFECLMYSLLRRCAPFCRAGTWPPINRFQYKKASDWSSLSACINRTFSLAERFAKLAFEKRARYIRGKWLPSKTLCRVYISIETKSRQITTS